MRHEQLNKDKRSSGSRLALALILFGVAASLAVYNGTITKTTARVVQQDQQFQSDGKIDLMPPMADLLGLQNRPSPKLPPANSGGGGQQQGVHFEIFNLDTFEANLKAELQSKTVGYSYAIYENTVNATLQQQEFNRAFVLMQYFGYLRRNPNDAPEPSLNYDGYNFFNYFPM